MNLRGDHLGLRQVVMALMFWAIDVLQKLYKVMQYRTLVSDFIFIFGY